MSRIYGNSLYYLGDFSCKSKTVLKCDVYLKNNVSMVPGLILDNCSLLGKIYWIGEREKKLLDQLVGY